MSYPCPNCQKPSKVLKVESIVRKTTNAPVQKRTRDCTDTLCGTRFSTAEVVIGDVTEHYKETRIREKADKETAKNLADSNMWPDGRKRTPPVLAPMVCPHCYNHNPREMWIRSTVWEEDGVTCKRYHGCRACNENFYTYTDSETNRTTFHKKVLPKEQD